MSVLKIKKNGEWIPVSVGAQGPVGPVGPAGAGSGDMVSNVYDPQGKAQDIFKYTDDKIAAIPTPDVSGQINAHNADGSAHADIRQAVVQAESNANSYTDQKIAAIPAPDVSGQINAHNEDVSAHSDIRALIPTSAEDLGLDGALALKSVPAAMPSVDTWQRVTYGGGKFVAVAHNSDKAAYSTDGINWVGTTLPSKKYWMSATYGDGKFVAIAMMSTAAAYSTDGINWEDSVLPVDITWRSVSYGNGVFVAVGSGTNAAYSTDGINWVGSTMPSSANWFSSTYGNGVFVAVVPNSDKVAHSTDGINWVESTMPSSANWYLVTYGNGKFVAVTNGSNKTAYSADGINWTETTLPRLANWRSVTYGNDLFVAVAYDSDVTAYSADGVDWVESTMPSSAKWQLIIYGADKFVAIEGGTSNVVAYSTDGINWRSEFAGLFTPDGTDVTDQVAEVLGVNSDPITPESIGAPTVDEMNAAIAGITPASIGAAVESHTHTPASIGAVAANNNLVQLVNGSMVTLGGTAIDSGGSKMQLVSYAGSGGSGKSGACSVTFDFVPDVVRMIGFVNKATSSATSAFHSVLAITLHQSSKNKTFVAQDTIICSMLTTAWKSTLGMNYGSEPSTSDTPWADSDLCGDTYAMKSADGKTISWYYTSGYGTPSIQQFNQGGYTYYVLGIKF